MDRRKFLGTAAAVLIPPLRRQVALTFDDFTWQGIPGFAPGEALVRLLEPMARCKARAILYVKGSNVRGEQGRELLRRWAGAGHLIGNHTFDHPDLNGHTITAEAFTADIARCEEEIGNLPGFVKRFRFPFLHEGETREKRDQVRQWLAEHGYSLGHVTIDTSDWYYDQRLKERLRQQPGFERQRYLHPYLEHMLDRAAYYDGLSQQVLGRSVRHTLLLHYLFLNVLFLEDLLAAFEQKGWQIIGAPDAYTDPVFARVPDIVPAGESLIWGLAKETGRYLQLRYSGEDGSYEKQMVDRIR
jgi:hypothetical protein